MTDPVADPADPRLVAARAVFDRVATAAGHPPGHLGDVAETVVIRDGAALVVRRGPVLVRVRPDTAPDRATAQREVQVATLLQRLAVPVTPLCEPDHQPFTVGDHVVTAWIWVEAGAPGGAFDLGALARTLRERTARVADEPDRPDLPAFDPLAAITGAVADLPETDPEARYVRLRAAELADAYHSAVVDDPLGRALVHGDLHRGNVVDGPAGPLLTDLELAGWGGAAYDAAPSVVAVDRYGAPPTDRDRFLAGFGTDPRPWPGFAVYVSVYELWVTAWAVGVRHRDPAWAEEATRRIQTLRDTTPHTWHLH